MEGASFFNKNSEVNYEKEFLVQGSNDGRPKPTSFHKKEY